MKDLVLKWIKPEDLDAEESHRVMVQDYRLIHGDFNLAGIAEGVLHPAAIPGGGRFCSVTGWNNDQDCFTVGDDLLNPFAVAKLPD